MKILILYFSGTGNTYFAAKSIKESISSEQYITLSPVETFNPERITDFDILMFGFPVYACRMPGFLKSFTDKFALPKTKKMILFSTFAGMPCNAMQKAANYFSGRGFNVIYSKGLKLPGSDALTFIKKKSLYAKKLLNKDFKKGIKSLTEGIKYAIYHDKSRFVIKKNVFLAPVDFSMKLIKPIEHKLSGKLYANEKCTLCGICEAVCPVDNIKIKNGKVIFKNNCVLCLRCITQCPAEAIQIGSLTKDTIRWKGPDHNFNAYLLLKENNK